jgi:hypothetical protein
MELTDEQINQAFEAVLGLPPRLTDTMVLRSMGATVENLALLIWDHWLGEPDEPSLQQVTHQIIDTLHLDD